MSFALVGGLNRSGLIGSNSEHFFNHASMSLIGKNRSISPHADLEDHSFTSSLCILSMHIRPLRPHVVHLKIISGDHAVTEAAKCTLLEDVLNFASFQTLWPKPFADHNSFACLGLNVDVSQSGLSSPA
jgi:hypothetical protein